jgi:predicted dehydrogenase
MTRPKLVRRQFLLESVIAAGLAATAAAPARADEPDDGPKAGPNDAVRVAVVGVRGRGMEHVGGFGNVKDARIVAICDCDERVIGNAMKTVSKQTGSEPKFYQDIRKLLEDKDIDAISVATPNHWHALATIWACQAGKDVYVEKPVSHNVREGRKMVEAAEKYKKIVQTGTQCRSHKGMQDAMAFIRSGKLGKVYMAKGLCYKPRGSIGYKPDGEAPKGLDYNLWTGPAEMKPYNENRLHYNWHWFWNTGNGDLGNQGIHQMDLARWALDKDTFPVAVCASGGRFGYDDQAETPNTLAVAFDYPDESLHQFEVRGLNTNDELGVRIGDIIYGSEGILAISSYTDLKTFWGPKLEPGEGGRGGGDHFANFIAAVKSRDASSLNAPILQGHLSSAYCHLGNIAYRLGRKLQINPSSETFVDDSEADAMLSREYRKGFEVPDQV